MNHMVHFSRNKNKINVELKSACFFPFASVCKEHGRQPKGSPSALYSIALQWSRRGHTHNQHHDKPVFIEDVSTTFCKVSVAALRPFSTGCF